MARPVSRLVSFGFPLRRRTAYFDMAESDDVLRQSCQQILETAPGERLGRPAFGCMIRRRVFESMDPTFDAMCQQDIRDALSAWEPRVTVVAVEIASNPDEHVAAYRVRVRPVAGTGRPIDVTGEIPLRSAG